MHRFWRRNSAAEKPDSPHISPAFSAWFGPARKGRPFFNDEEDEDDEWQQGARQMLMVALVGCCIIAAAFIGSQRESMRRMQRIRVEKDDRADR